ncbi:MAG: hypothetical protein ACI8PZ_000472 [Myxococcota bacterium]|jgi:hypothetical protein
MADEPTLWERTPLGFRLVLGMGIPYGVIMGAFFWAQSGDPVTALVATLASGALFGGAMAVWGTVSQAIHGTRSGTSEPGDLGVNQSRTFTVLGGRTTVLTRARATLRVMGVRVDRDDAELGLLDGVTGTGFWSLGECIAVTVKERDGVCEVTVTSRPWLPTTLVDSGTNRNNVERIEQALHDLATAEEAVETANDRAANRDRAHAAGRAREPS